jgi:hypothetical protein
MLILRRLKLSVTKKSCTLVLLPALISACAVPRAPDGRAQRETTTQSVEPTYVTKPVEPTHTQSVKPRSISSYITEAKHYVVNQTRDPESVRFQNVFYAVSQDSHNDQSYSVCGEFNAKNAYGGYVGYAQFLYRNDHPDVGPSLFSKAQEEADFKLHSQAAGIGLKLPMPRRFLAVYWEVCINASTKTPAPDS